MTIYINSWVVILSKYGIVKKWYKPMCADDAVKIYDQHVEEELINNSITNTPQKISGSFQAISNKWIEDIIKNWRGDTNVAVQMFLHQNYICEYGNTKIELLHSSKT